MEFAYVPFYGSWRGRTEAQFADLRYFTLKSPDHRSHREQARMIRRYIARRNTHTTDPQPQKIITRAGTIKRVKVT